MTGCPLSPGAGAGGVPVWPEKGLPSPDLLCCLGVPHGASARACPLLRPVCSVVRKPCEAPAPGQSRLARMLLEGCWLWADPPPPPHTH